MEIVRSSLLNKIRVASVEEKNQKLGLSVLSLILFIVFTFVFFIPSVKNIFEISESNKQLDSVSEDLNETLKIYTTASNYYKEISSSEGEFLKLIPSDGAPFDTLSFVNSLAVNNNIFLKQASLEVKDKGVEAYLLKFSGSYPKIVGFIKDLEKSPRFFYLKSLDLDSEKGKFSGNIEISANLVTFYVQ